ncbi:hypothetical protein HID58_042318 [Brassica napus]|uniref:60S ribosomal protein L27 n=1 Tax=Brassica napus TaxID=3708 RepID=A0ABQ8BEZ8_BRANA|nr:hypothetical protein HID58_042318 [Brassica napus]
MVKFLKQNKAVILLQGRYAGKKAVIIRSFDDGNRERPYGHCLVAGLKKYPSKHLMPTRYTLDVDLKEVATLEALSSKDKKVAALKEAKAKLEERFKTGKNRWFFTKLSITHCARVLAVSEL